MHSVRAFTDTNGSKGDETLTCFWPDPPQSTSDPPERPTGRPGTGGQGETVPWVTGRHCCDLWVCSDSHKLYIIVLLYTMRERSYHINVVHIIYYSQSVSYYSQKGWCLTSYADDIHRCVQNDRELRARTPSLQCHNSFRGKSWITGRFEVHFSLYPHTLCIGAFRGSSPCQQ